MDFNWGLEVRRHAQAGSNLEGESKTKLICPAASGNNTWE